VRKPLRPLSRSSRVILTRRRVFPCIRKIDRQSASGFDRLAILYTSLSLSASLQESRDFRRVADRRVYILHLADSVTVGRTGRLARGARSESPPFDGACRVRRPRARTNC